MRRTDQERQNRQLWSGARVTTAATASAGEWNYPIEEESTAANIDWERWLGPVEDPRRSSAPNTSIAGANTLAIVPGLLGDLVPHRLHPLMLASGKPGISRASDLYRHAKCASGP